MTEESQGNRLETLALTLVFASVSVALLAVIGQATRTGPASAGWWARPWFFPAVALSGLVLMNAITLWREIADLRRSPPSADEWHEARRAILGWFLPLEYLAYLAAYVWALGAIGYGPATLVFVMYLVWRAGLWGWRWGLAGLALVAFMLLVFRVGLGVWMPAPDLYDMFPREIRAILLRWF